MFRIKQHASVSLRIKGGCPGWACLLMAGMLALGLAVAQAAEQERRPIQTRSGMKAALKEAAKSILEQSKTKMIGSAVDQTKIPHYFGPFPNWVNSPLTLADVAVTVNGDGTGAAASATVWANGTVTGVVVTNPGSGYTKATVTIAPASATGTGAGAAAEAVINASGSVTAITVNAGGAGYISPVASVSGGGAATDAIVSVYGGVDAVMLTKSGGGYTFPTVDFDLPDNPDGVPARGHADFDPATGTITAVVVDQSGSGYSTAPNVVIRDGTLFEPIKNGGQGATAMTTLTVQSVVLNSFGSGYTSPPSVDIIDTWGSGAGATATAVTDFGAITAINVTMPGSGYITTGGIKKFQDTLPGLGNPSVPSSRQAAMNNLGQYVPMGVPDTTTFTRSAGFKQNADYYVIALVQHRERMSSSLPAQGTLLREYVQLETPTNASWSRHVPLQNDLLDGTAVPALMPDGSPAFAVDDPHMLGPVIVATKDRPVRIVFYNLLPTGSGGNLFLPVDSSMMGSGMGPMAMMPPADEGTVTDMVRDCECTQETKGENSNCFKDNRATLHLHGGTTPWISDGTPHQWITPANENTPWPQGVDVSEVPDMVKVPGVPDATSPTDGCTTFYYTNQQSARLLFYHDHSWGITRLNVYVGEAAGYLITDPTERKLFGSGGRFADLGRGTPLIIQDRTFVPQAAQLAEQDPTWDESRWGGYGNLWQHHVYMPAQNPSDPSGMSDYGRWMYGPWFWPPYNPPHGTIANPYYNMDPNADPPFSQPLAVPANLDDPATWQYQVPPFCEPPQIPGTPNISVGMEQFCDTPIVNGTAYPTVTLKPKAYRFRILNAANDRFWNLQWYVADPRTGTDSEVALNPAEVAAAQLDPNVFPTPDTSNSPPGPSWIQIASEGGFLPAPAVIPNQPITWITDPTRFDVGNVDKHSLTLACAERADVIVDFSQYAGQTLILYNDAPAAFPARVAGYDYYTGNPDLSPAGAPTTLPGYGPNTRTIMQVKILKTTPAAEFDLAALNEAFQHHADGSGVFESGQHPVIVGQAAYNSAYGTNFAASSWCNDPANPDCTTCDGFVRISEQGGDLFGFNTLMAPDKKLSIKLEPKALHDEMNSTSFDEYGRMQATLGIEAVPATPAAQNVTLYPFVNPPTEIIDGTNLPMADVKVTPITMADGTQIWKITHNGVDTHPIHFHLFDVQVLNRVTWDNIILQPDANELGWKDTVRTSPLEDTLVALRPVLPSVPFELPNAIRPMNPMMPLGDTSMFNNVSPQGIPTNPITNQLVNFGWEYMYHCHILSHEEMDMMRPVLVAVPPIRADGLAYTVAADATSSNLTLTWNDNSITETAFVVQGADTAGNWKDLSSIPSPLDQPNTHGTRSFTDTNYPADMMVQYRVVAQNLVGYGAEFPSVTVRSESDPVAVSVPIAPANLVATVLPTAKSVVVKAGAVQQVSLTWTGTAANATAFVIERSVGGAKCEDVATVPANSNAYIDSPTAPGTYSYRAAAVNATGKSTYSNTVSVTVDATPTAEGEGEGEDDGPHGCFGRRQDGPAPDKKSGGGALVASLTAGALLLIAGQGNRKF